jgi:thiol-disulfide isomerase/thioredoxin
MIELIGKEQLEEFIWENNDKVIVLYFGADWCGPCKKLKERLMSPEARDEMPNLIIGHLDVDIDENNEISDIYGVKNLPTQIFIKLDGTQIVELEDRIIGYDWTKFIMTYNKITNKN